MRGKDEQQGSVFSYVSAEERIPADHPLRAVRKTVEEVLRSMSKKFDVVYADYEGIGIRHGVITTVHDVTNTQTVVDLPHKDLRRARSALMSLIPTTTGSATAIGRPGK